MMSFKKQLLDRISPIQTFDDVEIDLSSDEEMLHNYKESVLNVQQGALRLEDALDKAESSELYKKLTQAEKSVAINNIINHYQDKAKENFRVSYPIIDQLILDNKINQEQ